MRCAVFGCNNNNQSKDCDKNVKFFTFPKQHTLRKLWEIACCRADKLNADTARVCSKHFCADNYERNLKYELLNYLPKGGKRLLKDDAIPTLFLPKNKSNSKSEVIG